MMNPVLYLARLLFGGDVCLEMNEIPRGSHGALVVRPNGVCVAAAHGDSPEKAQERLFNQLEEIGGRLVRELPRALDNARHVHW